MSSEPNYQWEDLLDIDDSDLPLTPVLRPCNRHVRETITITSTQNTNGADDSVLSAQEYMKQVVEDVGEDKDFNSEPWVGATEYSKKANVACYGWCLGEINTFLKNGKLEQVVAIIKSCSLNALGDLKVTIKDLSGTLAGSIHYKVINKGGYGKEITVGSAIILANVSVFSPNPSMHYLNITKKNVVKIFHKDFVPEEEMADLELHVCGNVIDQEDLYKFDEEALDLVLEEEARESRAHEEWLEKCRQQEEEDAEDERQLLAEGGGALGANKAITHPLGAVEATCALEMDVMRALDLVEVEAVGALDLVECAVDLPQSSLSLENFETTSHASPP
ncbi:hypothetical protein Tco_1369064 [Tanacetum coccineum]